MGSKEKENTTTIVMLMEKNNWVESHDDIDSNTNVANNDNENHSRVIK